MEPVREPASTPENHPLTEAELFRAYRNLEPEIVTHKARCGYPMCRNESQLDSIFCSDCELRLLEQLG